MTDRARTQFQLERIQEFVDRGFLTLHNFLDVPEVQALTTAVEALPTDARSSRVRRGTAFARRNLLELDFIRALILKTRVRELVDAIAPESMAVRAILFDKAGAANWTVPWHQDRSIAVRERIEIASFGPWSTKGGVIHVQPPVEILRAMFALRFHLDPCGTDNGPLRVISGTHHHILESNEIETAVATQEQISCLTRAGGLLVMRPLLLHASSPATKPSHRRVIHIEFGPLTLPAGLQWAFPGTASSPGIRL